MQIFFRVLLPMRRRRGIRPLIRLTGFEESLQQRRNTRAPKRAKQYGSNGVSRRSGLTRSERQLCSSSSAQNAGPLQLTNTPALFSRDRRFYARGPAPFPLPGRLNINGDDTAHLFLPISRIVMRCGCDPISSRNFQRLVCYSSRRNAATRRTGCA